MNKNWKLVNFCEFDKYAANSYCAIHSVDENLNLGDITKVDETKLEPFNLIVGGSPCQDFSVAGKQKGSVWKCKDCGEEYNPLQVHWSKRNKCPKCNSENLDKSRSSLLVEWLRIIRANKPNFGIYENVKNIVGKQFKETTFKIFEEELHEYGYNTYWKVLNAKNYGIPQNRERVYLILIKKELDNGKFKFPQEFDNGVRLKDILEDEVDSKYYLSEEVQNRFKFSEKQNDNIIGSTKPDFRTIGQRDLVFNTDGIMGCLVATDYKQPKQILETNNLIHSGDLEGGKWDKINESCRRVYDEEGIAPTIHTCQGGNTEPKVITRKITEPTICEQRCDEGLRFFKDDICGALRTIDSCGDKRVIEPIEENNKMIVVGNTVPSGHTAGRIFDTEGISPTMMERHSKVIQILDKPQFRIRKLTPKECYRLMGFSDEDFYKAQSVKTSDTQLYKQAGNSIVVDVLYYIYKELYIAMPYLFDDLKLSSFFSGIGAFEKALDRLYKDINNGVNFTQPQVN